MEPSLAAVEFHDAGGSVFRSGAPSSTWQDDGLAAFVGAKSQPMQSAARQSAGAKRSIASHVANLPTDKTCPCAATRLQGNVIGKLWHSLVANSDSNDTSIASNGRTSVCNVFDW